MRGRAPRVIWSIWVNICAALLLFVVLEGIARISEVVFRRALFGDEQQEAEGLRRAGTSAETAWVRDYLREADELRTRWQPYVYWRIRAHRGQHINVDSTGNRHTWNSTSTPSPSQLRIFMFGGSALWGIGARDEFTIPSLVSKRLARQTTTGVRVTNFGEIGWVNTQEIIALMLELRRGNVPDIVVFYDGANEYASAFQSGGAGIPQNEGNRVAEFNLLRGGGDSRRILFRRLALYRWIERATRSARGSQETSLPGDNPVLIKPLAEDVVDVYVGNVELVESLSNRYGFKAFFFWQPLIYSKRNPSPSEREELARRGSRRGAPLAALAHKTLKERMSTGKLASLYDLADVFGDDGRMAFVDSVHLVESANDRVAGAMVQVLQNASRRASRR